MDKVAQWDKFMGILIHGNLISLGSSRAFTPVVTATLPALVSALWLTPPSRGRPGPALRVPHRQLGGCCLWAPRGASRRWDRSEQMLPGAEGREQCPDGAEIPPGGFLLLGMLFKNSINQIYSNTYHMQPFSDVGHLCLFQSETRRRDFGLSFSSQLNGRLHQDNLGSISVFCWSLSM